MEHHLSPVDGRQHRPTPADKAAPVLIAAAALTATVYLSLAAWVLLAGA